jgi:hypothetical protein
MAHLRYSDHEAARQVGRKHREKPKFAEEKVGRSNADAKQQRAWDPELESMPRFSRFLKLTLARRAGAAAAETCCR